MASNPIAEKHIFTGMVLKASQFNVVEDIRTSLSLNSVNHLERMIESSNFFSDFYYHTN